MFGDEVHDGNSGRCGHLPRIVQLDLRHGLHPHLPRLRPVFPGPRARADRRHGVFADLDLHAAAVQGFRPFANRHEPDRFGQLLNDVQGIAVAVPSPVPGDYAGLGGRGMHPGFDGGIYFGHDFRVRAVPAA